MRVILGFYSGVGSLIRPNRDYQGPEPRLFWRMGKTAGRRRTTVKNLEHRSCVGAKG